MLKYGVDIFDKNDTRDDELNVRKWMSDRLNRRRVAQTIYIMESRSTLNSTSPSFLTPQYRTQSPFKEYFHRIIENYHSILREPLQAPMTPSESEVQTLLGPKRPPTTLPPPLRHLRTSHTPPWHPLLHDPKTETPQQELWPMTSKTHETIEKNRVWQTLRSLVRVRFQSWEDYPYWHCNQRLTMSLTVEASYLDAFSIERDARFRRDSYIVCVGFNLKFFHLLNLLWTNSSTTPQISHFQLLRGFSFCPTTAVVVV